ncbi:MAG: TDT family transporter [Rhodospirillaceae bacterium]|nr:TDT family transporter [Rhodospirillaceae bacterium]
MVPMSRLNAFPSPAGGLALGIASLAWAWEVQVPSDGAIQTGGALIAAVIAGLLTLKFVFNPRTLMLELAHPVIGSVIPTMAMASMVVSVSIGKVSSSAASFLWLTAVVAHIGFLILFTVHRAREPRLHHMVPSWFVPPIGPVVAVLSIPDVVFRPLAEGLLWFGIVSYAVMLPLMLHRLIFSAEVPVPAKPTIAILAAPPNLCLAGYLTFNPSPNSVLVLILLGLGALMAVVVYLAFWELLRLPFSPGYAAFTFPTVIAATASFKAAAFLERQGFAAETIAMVRGWGGIELVIATLVVGYVALRYVLHYGRPVPLRAPT